MLTWASAIRAARTLSLSITGPWVVAATVCGVRNGDGAGGG